MKLADFSGGLRLKPAPHMIAPNEAREYVNINTDRGVITPLKDKKRSNIQGAKKYGSFYIAEDAFLFSDTPTDYEEYQNRMYFTDRTNKVQKVIGGVTYQAGITKPVISSVTPIGSEEKITWAVTFYNSVDGSESGPELTIEYSATPGNLNTIIVEESTDPQVDRVRLYRVGGNITRFSMVKEFLISDIIYNETTYLLQDTLADADIDGRTLETTDTTPGEDGLQYLTESYAMLFAAKDSRLYYTPIDRPWSWPALNFLSFPRPITAIGKIPNGLIVCTKFQTFLVTGTGPNTLNQQTLSSDQGAVNHDSLANIQDATMWASLDGICLTNGGPVQIITKSRLERITFDIDSNAMYNQKYYAHLTNGRTLVIDFDTSVFQYLDADIESVLVANNVLYGYKDNELHYLFEANSPLYWKWASGRYIGQGFSQPKLYKELRVYATGQVKFSVFIDGKLEGKPRDLEPGLNQIRVDKNVTRGYFIEFKAEGTGEILEIVWAEGSPNV